MFLILLTACGSSSPGETTPTSSGSHRRATTTPDSFVLTLHTVRVSPKRSDGSTTWDGAAPEKGDGCGVFSSLGAMMGDPSGGALVGQLCRMGGKKQAETDPSAPDLVAVVQTATRTLWTPVSPDTAFADLSKSFLIQKDDVPPEGVKLSLYDQDGSEVPKGELIGQVRLGPREFVRRGLHTHQSHELTELSLSVTAAEPIEDKAQTFTVSAQAGLVDTGVTVRAGETLRIEATGRYVVSAWDGSDIGPEGLAEGKRNYNLSLPVFKEAPHGAAIALVTGDATATHATLVGPCAVIEVPVSGTLSLGINDRDAGNNHGELVFSVQRGAAVPCGRP